MKRPKVYYLQNDAIHARARRDRGESLKRANTEKGRTMGGRTEDVKWYRFWNPWSGYIGGTIMGLLVILIIVVLRWVFGS